VFRRSVPKEHDDVARLKELEGYAIGATDGALGEVKDFLLDDEAWVVRYLVVDTGSWLSNRRVRISPIAIGKPSWSDGTLRVPMTTEQVRNSPDVDTNKPVSRQYEMGYFGYYGYYPYYRGTSDLWGAGNNPSALQPGVSTLRKPLNRTLWQRIVRT
jgi:hypothetical protein